MISIARIFGAPVTDPPGNAARSKSNASAPSANCPVTVDTRWCTVGCDSSANSLGTSTDLGRHTFPRSLRSRSTIMTFSARSFSLSSSSRCRVEPQKPLRRDAGDLRAGKLEICPERRRITGTQAAIQRERRAGERRMKALRQVDLIDIARGDVFANARDSCLELGARKVGLGWG